MVLYHIIYVSLQVFVFNLPTDMTVGLQKILSLLESEDASVRIHAVKVVANLAAEGVLLSHSLCYVICE